MSREININRQLLGLEDLLFGVGIVTQTRAGQSVNITRINASNLPFDETQTLLEWAQSINLEVLGSMITQLQTIYDNITVLGNVEDNLPVVNEVYNNIAALQSLYTNISKLQNIDANMTKLQAIDTNMSKLQNIDTNMSKLQNIDTNMSKLLDIYIDLAKLSNLYDNLSMLTNIYDSLAALTAINSQVIPNIPELLLVNDNAAQVAMDKADVASMKIDIESIYDTITDNSHNHTIANVTGLQTALDNKVDDSEKGSANGVATLDVNGKVVLTQIPDSVLGQLEYQGVWDFTTLPTAIQKGQYWIASVNGNGYIVGDWAVWNGSSFDKVDNTDAVATVAGRTGNVVLTKADVGLSNVDNTADANKTVLSATKLTTPRNINGVSFDGTANITIADNTKLPIGGKAADSELLDGRDSTGYLYKTGPGSVNFYGFNVNGDNQVMLGYYNTGWKNTLEMGGLASNLTYWDSAGSAKTIWNSGNMGSGSGLDADKLDGVDSTLYLQSKNLGPGSLLNTIGSGIYRYEAAPDSPNGGYGTLLSVRGSNNEGTALADTLGQIAFDYDFPGSTITGNSKNHYIRGAVATTDSWNPNSAVNSPFDLLYTNKNLGYLLGFSFLSRYTSNLNGATDITSALQNALNNNKVVYIDIGSTPYINGNIQMPQGTRLSCLAPATLRGNTQLRIGPYGVINPNAYCVIENLGISKMASQYVFNEVAGLSTGGVAIQTTNFGNPIVNVQILDNIITGFNIGIDTVLGGDTGNNTRGRWVIRGNKLDNMTDIRAGYCLDTMYVSDCHSYPFLGSSIVNGTWNVVNSGGTFRNNFIFGDNQYNDWFLVTNCFSHSNRKMIEGYFNGKILGGGYDCEDYSSSGNFDTANNIGLYLTTTGSTRGITTITGVSFNGGQLHCKFVFDNDNNGISMINMSGCHHDRFRQAAVGIKDNNGIAGGGIVNITGATTSPGPNGGTPDYIWIQTGYSKLNVSGWLRMGATNLQYKEATATYQSTGEMTL